jgi:hypothetical protein
VSHRIPTAVEHHGDAKHLAIAASAYIVELIEVPRVLTCYDEWRVVRAPADREFELLLAEYPETIQRYIDEMKWQDHVAMRPFVETLIHRLPATWIDMTTSELLRAFRIGHYHGRERADTPPIVRPTEPPQFGVVVELQPTHPRGYVPHDPSKGRRGVRWLIRRYVQSVPLQTLAREYAADTGRAGDRNDPLDCLRDVKRNIQQAWALLDLAATLPWSPTKPGHIVTPSRRTSL